MYLSKSIKDIKLFVFSNFYVARFFVILIISSSFFSCSNEEIEDPSTELIIPLNCNVELAQALGYNAFVRYGVSLTSGDSEGPLAMGGDLTLNGLFTAAAHTAGTLYYDNESQASSLVVNGKINYVANEGIHLNNGFVKIGDLSGSIAHDIDDNNAVNNTRITQGGYNDEPRIHVQRNQNVSTVNAIDIIDFEAAFVALDSSAMYYSEFPNNVQLQEGNKITLLDNSFNVLHLTGEELNNLTNFTFNNQPTPTSPLIINIDQEEDFIWDVQNQAGIGDQHGAHIIFNFYNNSSSITLDDGGATVIGTVLAPNSHVIKRTSGNINGQLIAASYDHISGELHQQVFNTCDENVCDLIVDLGDDIHVAFGEVYTLIANTNFEGVTYEWSTNETTQAIDLSLSETTTYTVTVTLENGCIATDSITITVGDDPCISQEFLVDAFPVVENLIDFLNIDIAIDRDQIINYATYELDGSIVGLPIDIDLTAGCNTILLNLAEHFDFVSGTQYTLVVTGDSWTVSIEFTIP